MFLELFFIGIGLVALGFLVLFVRLICIFKRDQFETYSPVFIITNVVTIYFGIIVTLVSIVLRFFNYIK